MSETPIKVNVNKSVTFNPGANVRNTAGTHLAVFNRRRDSGIMAPFSGADNGRYRPIHGRIHRDGSPLPRRRAL
jgi:hypothetical protein